MAEITISKIRWLLDKAYPKIGNRPIAKITAHEVLAALRSIEASGRYESARRMLSVLGRVFRYAVATTRAERDPTGDLGGALTVPKPKHLAAITTEKRTGDLMRAIVGGTGHAMLRLSAHLFVRPDELRQAEWAEFDFDRSIWDIPAEKMTMRRAYRVPLSTQVASMVEELWELTGTGRYCFPPFRTDRRPMCENTVNSALSASRTIVARRRSSHSACEIGAESYWADSAGIMRIGICPRELPHGRMSTVEAQRRHGECWSDNDRDSYR